MRWFVAACLALGLDIHPMHAAGPNAEAITAVQNANDEVARLYAEGKYGEGLALAKATFEKAQKQLGEDHPSTLTSLNNLAFLYQSQGRYGEAEPLYKRAMNARERVLGKDHPSTLSSLNNLAGLYRSQGRYGEAEPLYKRAMDAKERVLGKDHPDTLTSLNNLAGLYESQGRYGEAEPLYKRAMDARERVLGKDHPNTLSSLNNLAGLYKSQGRYGEAEPLYKRAMDATERVLGKDHPDTLTSLNNLAGLYESQGRYGEAEPLFKRAMDARERVLGKDHPDTLTVRGNLAALLTASGRTEEALRQFQALDASLALWLGKELQTTQGAALRRQLLEQNARYQNAIYSFALAYPSDEARRFGADLTLRWKKRLAQDEAVLDTLIRNSRDPGVEPAAREVMARRQDLERGLLDPRMTPAARKPLIEKLEAAETELRQRSAVYRRYLGVREARSQDVQALLPLKAALIEYRFFKNFDFKKGKFGGAGRLLAIVITPSETPAVVDLGEAKEIMGLRQALLAQTPKDENDAGLGAILHERLIAPLAQHLQGVETLFIAPDGGLHALPFDMLADGGGKRLGETYAVRMVLTGRDLVLQDRPALGKGLVALGGVDFGKCVTAPKPDEATGALPRHAALDMMDRPRGDLGCFDPLDGSAREVRQIAEFYRDMRKDEPTGIHTGDGATEGFLKRLPSPPRVLHLATHGFYRPSPPGDTSQTQTAESSGHSLLQSGVALANANSGRMGNRDADGENGILYALEAQTLNLYGTELVVLSACETALGAIDYSEGMEGLPRAFYLAGAKNVLVTLWPVGDSGGAEFMQRFYSFWLQQNISDPAAALRETKAYFRERGRPAKMWAAYVLYEG